MPLQLVVIDVCVGLGGTSLVNANVFLRPDPRVFQAAEWPSELREPGILDKCM
jgi:hypothetical protein